MLELHWLTDWLLNLWTYWLSGILITDNQTDSLSEKLVYQSLKIVITNLLMAYIYTDLFTDGQPGYIYHMYWMADWLSHKCPDGLTTGSLSGWLTDGLTCQLFYDLCADWLIDLQINWPTGCRTHQLSVSLTDKLAMWMTDQLTNSLTYRISYWLIELAMELNIDDLLNYWFMLSVCISSY